MAGATKLWTALYGMIWIVFFEFCLGHAVHRAWSPSCPSKWRRGPSSSASLFSNNRGRAQGEGAGTREADGEGDPSPFHCDGRPRGPPAPSYRRAGWAFPVFRVTLRSVVLFLHVVNAFAITTQAAAVAIPYDRWEETEPGAVPPKPPAARPAERQEDASLRQGL